ncbi:MAG: acyltransferase family protein [Anaerolineaceae bacterium]
MNKRLLFLNGLSILAVVVSHAAGWGQGVMTSEKWQGIFLSLGLKGYDIYPGPAYFILTAARMLATFAVPSFFFVTGFFIAYANRGTKARYTFRVVLARIAHFFIPYTFWSILIFSVEYLFFNQRFAILEYLWIFVSFGAAIHFYYVPALALFYLSTPVIIPFIRRHAKSAIIIAFTVQLGLLVFNWLTTYQYVVIDLPYPFSIQPWFPSWWVSRWIFFGTLGIMCGFIPEIFNSFLIKNRKRHLVLMLGFLGALIAVEIAARVTELPGFELAARLLEQVFALFFIFGFLVFQTERTPLAKPLNWLSGRIYGIYLLHFTVLDYLAHGFGLVAPFTLAYQLLFQLMLIGAGLGIPLLFMQLVAMSPLRKHYRFFFG